MQSINHVMIMGNLGADPVGHTSKSGTSYCRFSLATNFTRKNEQGEKETSTTWHRIKAFGKTAEHCQTYLKKGNVAIVDGYISNSTYKKPDGSNGWSSEIVAQQVTFLNQARRLPETDHSAHSENSADMPSELFGDLSSDKTANELPF